jgi:TPR repeat protein
MTNAKYKERGSHLKGLLKEKHYAALEDELQSRQLQIQRGEVSDELLRLDFESAFDSDPAIEPLLTEWISSYPHSYVARTARAFHYVAAAYSKRGTEFVSATSEEQFNAMEQQFKKASLDLNKALLLSEKPTLAYAEQISLARASCNYGTVAQVLRAANKKCPKSLAIKVAGAFALNPKWGGSFEELDQLVAFAEAAGMDVKEIAVLKYRIEIEKGNYFEVVTKQKSRAATHYRSAGELCEAYLPWENAIRTSYSIDDWANVIVAADRLLKLNPKNSDTIQRRGWAYENTKQMALAVKDYKTAAEMGNPWAQNKLGWILWQGTDLPKDVARAKKLFEQAAAQGNKNAQANLKALNAMLDNN